MQHSPQCHKTIISSTFRVDSELIMSVSLQKTIYCSIHCHLFDLIKSHTDLRNSGMDRYRRHRTLLGLSHKLHLMKCWPILGCINNSISLYNAPSRLHAFWQRHYGCNTVTIQWMTSKSATTIYNRLIGQWQCRQTTAVIPLPGNAKTTLLWSEMTLSYLILASSPWNYLYNVSKATNEKKFEVALPP